MKTQHLHHQSRITSAILSSVNPETFTPNRLTLKALNEDSCWEEYESDFDECLPTHLLSRIDDIDFS